MHPGLELRSKLKLDNYPNIKVGRITNVPSSYKIVLVVFDSQNPNRLIATSNLKFGAMPFRAFVGTNFTPAIENWVYIENYTAALANSLFIVIDLAGRLYRRFNLWAESLKQMPVLKEEFTLRQLARGIKNPHELKKYQQRMMQNKGVSFSRALWSEKEDSLSLELKIRPTGEMGLKKVFNPQGQKSKAPFYTAYLKFFNVSKYLSTKTEFFEILNRGERKRFLAQAIVNSPVRMWINDPSWLYRGTYENATDLDYSLYDFRSTGIPAQRGINAQKYYGTPSTPLFTLSKHALEIFTKIGLFAPSIQKRLEDNWVKERPEEFEEPAPEVPVEDPELPMEPAVQEEPPIEPEPEVVPTPEELPPGEEELEGEPADEEDEENL